MIQLVFLVLKPCPKHFRLLCGIGTRFVHGKKLDPQDQALYDEHTLLLWSTAALNAWDRIKKSEKRTKSYVRVKQGQREPFTNFLQRLTKVVQIGVTDPEARQIILESLTFENANLECKKILGPLKIRSAPMNKWILHTMNIEKFDYNTES